MLRLMIIFAYTYLASALKDGNAAIEEHPYQLALELDYVSTCGASLIAPNVALTAAQCTNGKDIANLTVRAGTTYKTNGGELASVVKICQHPKYNNRTLDYDVSVLLLSKSFLLGTKIKPIDLQPAKLEISNGTSGVVTGWELFSFQGSNLKRINVLKITDNTCKEAYSSQQVTNRMTCYIKEDRECKGDVGGPIVVYEKQVGIVSWGTTSVCGSIHYPAVYTKISDPEIANHIHHCLVY